ncbi:MAG: hypothetical protein NTU44_01260, partial [Bacteroidetes bacterium]|nr:hypothetical protein [Bacteroidota bacterium]
MTGNTAVGGNIGGLVVGYGRFASLLNKDSSASRFVIAAPEIFTFAVQKELVTFNTTLKMKKTLLLKPLLTMIILTLWLTSGHQVSAQVTIPDYSMNDRKDVPKELTWKIEDIYPDVETWKKEKEVVVKLIAGIDNYSGTWTSSAANMLAFMKMTDDLNLKLERLYNYASNQSNMDVGNTLYNGLKGEMESLYVQYGAKMAFVEPDLLKLGDAKFKEYLKEEPGLKVYSFGVEQTMRMKDHILPEDQQRIVTRSRISAQVPSSASRTLNNLEIPPAKVTLSTGKEVTLNIAGYMKYRGDKVPADRTLVMNTFWNNHKKFENTHAILLDGEMKNQLFIAQVNKYKDCLESRLFRENIDGAVYQQLVASVH